MEGGGVLPLSCAESGSRGAIVPGTVNGGNAAAQDTVVVLYRPGASRCLSAMDGESAGSMAVIVAVGHG
jgi:hypothetical protein